MARGPTQSVAFHLLYAPGIPNRCSFLERACLRRICPGPIACAATLSNPIHASLPSAQVEYIFSDKTGTLTSNEMQLRQIAVKGVAYGSTEVRGLHLAFSKHPSACWDGPRRHQMSSRNVRRMHCQGLSEFLSPLFVQVRLEENPDRTGLGALRLFDSRLYKAAAKVQHSTSWSDLVTAGGSTRAVMAHPTSYPNVGSAGSLGVADDAEPTGGGGSGGTPGGCAGA